MAERFDVVVLGGGAAGCVLAGRLSEDPDRTVCLLEAGPDYGPFGSGDWPVEILDARTLPETHAWETDDEDRSSWRARIIGGCSAHNACLVIRGTEEDYDEWGPGWTAHEIAPFLDRAQEMLRTQPANTSSPPPWHAAVVAGARSLGLSAGPYAANAVDGIRWNTAFAYLDRARSRPNLTIRAQTLADRLRCDAGRVIAAVLADGTEVAADVVAVCAGTYGSAAILLRSSIGPGLDIDLPVGENLCDHVGAGVEWVAAASVEPPNGFRSNALVETRDLHLVPWTYLLEDGTWSPGLTAFLMKPYSSGRLTLGSRDPAAPPLIDHAYLSDERDVAPVVEGIELCRRVARTDAVAPLVGEEAAPGDVDLDSYVREQARGYFHPVGTCAIGGVVGPDLRVHGFENLYVADASVMPTIPRANTHLTTVAIAERAAERL